MVLELGLLLAVSFRSILSAGRVSGLPNVILFVNGTTPTLASTPNEDACYSSVPDIRSAFDVLDELTNRLLFLFLIED